MARVLLINPYEKKKRRRDAVQKWRCLNRCLTLHVKKAQHENLECASSGTCVVVMVTIEVNR